MEKNSKNTNNIYVFNNNILLKQKYITYSSGKSVSHTCKIKKKENQSTLCFVTSLVVQAVKNLPATQETPVQFLGQEDLLEKG